MKKKNILFILIAVIFIIVAFICYKGFNLYYYNVDNMTTVDYEDFIKGFKITNTVSIKNMELETEKYLTFNNMKIRNDFEQFQKLDDQVTVDSIKYVLYDENDKLKASLWMSKTDTYVKLLATDLRLFGTEDKRITNTNLRDFLKKNNINSDIELFAYLEKNKDIKNNIFTSTKEMKENYTIHFITSVIMPLIESITLIEGDYEGYIFNLPNNIKEVTILKNNERYLFTFICLDYFTDDYIVQLLNTINISDEYHN